MKNGLEPNLKHFPRPSAFGPQRGCDAAAGLWTAPRRRPRFEANRPAHDRRGRGARRRPAPAQARGPIPTGTRWPRQGEGAPARLPQRDQQPQLPTRGCARSAPSLPATAALGAASPRGAAALKHLPPTWQGACRRPGGGCLAFRHRQPMASALRRAGQRVAAEVAAFLRVAPTNRMAAPPPVRDFVSRPRSALGAAASAAAPDRRPHFPRRVGLT